MKILPKPCVKVTVAVVTFLVKFCCSSFLRKQSSKVPSVGNGRNTVSRVLFWRRELTEFCGKLREFCEKLGEFAVTYKD